MIINVVVVAVVGVAVVVRVVAVGVPEQLGWYSD
jgi:hypothetical protein